MKAQLIYKSYMTYFHTLFPVYFYGLPNGKIVCIYACISEKENNKSGLEFVLAEHEDFIYDYHSGAIFIWGFKEITKQNFMDYVDRPDQRVVPMKKQGEFQSIPEALDFLNFKSKSLVNPFAVKDIIF